jgi:6-phosphofructokinase 1
MIDLRRVGVLTSGGDAPGMNACVRAIARTLIVDEVEVVGIRRGYSGLIDGDYVEMDGQSVSNIVQKGGTILKCARSERFLSADGRAAAAQALARASIDALIVVGGDGTLAGARLLSQEQAVVVVGCPATIDNDLFGTDETIGYDTALNTAIENIDRIRDTADAHDRVFLVEVMGADAGFIALNCAICGGAELVLLPEFNTDIDHIKQRIHSLMVAQARSSIVVVAEGEGRGGATAIAEALEADSAFEHIDLRVCILGHTQRGGAPSARDRVIASRIGAGAVKALMDGLTEVMVGIVCNEIRYTPLSNVVGNRKSINYELLKLAQMLS